MQFLAALLELVNRQMGGCFSLKSGRDSAGEGRCMKTLCARVALWAVAPSPLPSTVLLGMKLWSSNCGISSPAPSGL